MNNITGRIVRPYHYYTFRDTRSQLHPLIRQVVFFKDRHPTYDSMLTPATIHAKSRLGNQQNTPSGIILNLASRFHIERSDKIARLDRLFMG
jgi:hypothetical protein